MSHSSSVEQRLALVEAHEDFIRELADRAAAQSGLIRERVVVFVATPSTVLGQALALVYQAAPTMANRPLTALIHTMRDDLVPAFLAEHEPQLAAEIPKLPIEVGEVRVIAVGYGGITALRVPLGASPERIEA